MSSHEMNQNKNELIQLTTIAWYILFCSAVAL